jgi:hypothetical protein
MYVGGPWAAAAIERERSVIANSLLVLCHEICFLMWVRRGPIPAVIAHHPRIRTDKPDAFDDHGVNESRDRLCACQGDLGFADSI